MFVDILLPQALQAGVNITDYWDLTVFEINAVIDSYNETLKRDISSRYDTARLTACFVGMVLGGTDIPDIYEVYPGVFDADIDDKAAEEEALKQFSMLVTTINLQRKHSNERER